MKVCMGYPPPTGIKSRSLGHRDFSSSPSLLKLPVFLEENGRRGRGGEVASFIRTQPPGPGLCGLCGRRRCLKFHRHLDCPAIVKGPSRQQRIYFPSSVFSTPLAAFSPAGPGAGQLPSLHRAGLELAWHGQPPPPCQVSPFRSSFQMSLFCLSA